VDNFQRFVIFSQAVISQRANLANEPTYSNVNT
jgi:hypothetical protein